MKVAVGIQLTGFAAALFGLLAMCVPVVFVFLRNVYQRKRQREQEIEQDEGGNEDEHNEDDDDQFMMMMRVRVIERNIGNTKGDDGRKYTNQDRHCVSC